MSINIHLPLVLALAVAGADVGLETGALPGAGMVITCPARMMDGLVKSLAAIRSWTETL